MAIQDDLRLSNGAAISEEELNKYLSKRFVEYKCPSGGQYFIGPVGVPPTCTHTNVCYTYRFNCGALTFERRAWKHSLAPEAHLLR